ncbi:MAG TPA: interleukin-like EMT inducer domain-containing protein [Candidatus Omnitrophota bacterium]|nr:interleukin-like EMT inducer domain-containing protein [Candidatus Omnitrophota bacterium]
MKDTIILDTAVPAGGIQINGGAQYSNKASVMLTLTATDAGSGIDKMSFSTDGTTWTTPEAYATTKAFTLPSGDGSKTVYVKYYDKSGKVSVNYSKAIILDSVAPAGSLKINSGGAYTNSAGVALTLTGTDATSGVEKMSFSTDGTTWTTPEAYATTKAFTLSSGDGTKTVSVKLYDKAGNVSTIYSKTVILDSVAPIGSININSGAAYAVSPSVTLTLTGADATSGLDKMCFSVDGGKTWAAWEAVAATKTLTLPAGDGSKEVQYQLRDKAGLIATLKDVIILDMSAPQGSIFINDGAVETETPDLSLKLTASDAVSGVAKMRFSCDLGVTWTAWEAFAPVKQVRLEGSGGEKNIRCQIIDNAGNTASYDSKINYFPPAVVEFLSSSATDDSSYTLIYSVDGQEFRESWELSPGKNHLLVRLPRGNSFADFGEFEVTCTKAEYPEPLMPDIPALPEDLISTTTEDGLVLKYSGGTLVLAEKPGDYKMYLPELDAGQNLTGGLLVYESGDRLLYRNSLPLVRIARDGEKQLYSADGSVSSVLSADGKKVRFAYQKDAQGKVLKALSLEDSGASLYDAAGQPVRIRMADGTDVRYSRGMIETYTDAAGNVFSYEIAETKEGGNLTGYTSGLAFVMPTGSSVRSPVANILADIDDYPDIKTTLEEKLSLQIEYDTAGKMLRFTSGKGEVLTIENQLPVSLQDSLGNVTSIENRLDGDGNIISLDWNGGAYQQTFDNDGNLSGIRLDDETVLNIKSLKVDEIVLSDGSVLRDLAWDGNSLTGFVRARPDGSEETYKDSKIFESKDANGTVTTFVSIGGVDHMDKVRTEDGKTYQVIEYQNAQGLTERMTELVRVDLEDGAYIEFEHGKPARYVQKKKVQQDATEVPRLPEGESYVPSVCLANAELRSVTIDADANILSGEILFNDGTQYLIKNGELYKQITTSGKVIEFKDEPPAEVELPEPVPAAPLTVEEIAYRSELIEKQLDYFVNGVGIDADTGLPLDNYAGATGTQSNYSQATLVGFWAEILSAIARGDYTTPKMSRMEALQKLSALILEYRKVQQQAGWKGMVSFFTINKWDEPVLDEGGNSTGETRKVIAYERTFREMGLGDNLNLALSLSSVIGALRDVSLDPLSAAMRDGIMATADEILGAQDEAYHWFFCNGRFSSCLNIAPDGRSFSRGDGTMDRVFNEFRPGLIWLAARHPEYQEAVDNLDVAVRSYETAGGKKIDNAVPFDGGAFQMFWPLIHVDETKYSEFDTALRNFLYAQADYSQRNDIPGLLSAGDDPGEGYNGKMGLPAVAETDNPLSTDVGSIYGTASVFALAPHYTLQMLKNIETKYPQVKTSAGWVDAVKMKEVTTVDPVTGKTVTTKQPVFSNQYFGVDQAGFILSLLNKSQGYFANYLAEENLDESYDAIYRGMQFGLTPAAEKNPTPPDLGQMVMPLYDGTSPAPDGIGSGLAKRPAFISTVSDPELGEGQVFDYVNANGTYHHSEIEFFKACTSGTCGDSPEKKVMNLQEYLLLHGRAEMAKTLFEGFSLDVLNEAESQGAFYTAGYGYANSAFSTDAKMGEIRRLNFDLEEVSKPVGIWAKYDTFDLNPFDYLSVPVRLGPDTPVGTGLKFELKGLGEIYVTGPLTEDWQYFQIPVVKPAGNLGEIAVVVQSADGKAIKGEVELGPLSAFKVRNSTRIDWSAALGMSDYQVRNLLKEKVLTQAGGGEVIETEEILENFTIDSTGKLVNGTLRRADGGIQYFSEGKLRKWVFKNGRTVTFENGLASFVLDLARGTLEEGRFYYDQSLNGTIRSFVLQDNDRKRIFGSDGSLETIVENGYTANFKDGKIDTLVTPKATLSGIEWLEDRSILRAHVKSLDGREFDIGRDVEQMIDAGDGVKVYYKGLQIAAIETPRNGRTDFSYTFNAEGQVVGVNAAFIEEVIDPETGLENTVSRTISLFEYINRPERALETGEILRETPVNVLPNSSVGGFRCGPISDIAAEGYKGPPASLSYWYDNPTGAEFGLYAIHDGYSIDLSNFSFLVTKLSQNQSITWDQEYILKLKTYSHGGLCNFSIDGVTSTPQTFWFPLAGKQGTEVEITVEPQRCPEGVRKGGSLVIDGLTYVALKTLDKPLWEAEIGMTTADVRSVKTESENLLSVGSEVASGKPLVYDELVSLLDLPTRMIYSDLSETATGELVNFRRFDGSVVELKNKAVTQVILPNGTVNDYSGSGNSATGVIEGPDGGEGGASVTDYHYGALRKITQADGRMLDFSYEFDDSGAEITVIRDSVSGDERRFKDGKLLRSDSANKTETNYRYENGELAAAELTYKNKIIESTRYRFANDETQVTDDRGTTWYYDANGNLTKHLTRDGYLFRYADYTMTLPAGVTPDPDDFKSGIYGKDGLKAVHLAGYEAKDGSQLLCDAENPGKAEIKLIEGDHAVNIEMDSNRRIRSGQIQFKDGLVIEIENYIPVRGRLANGELFSVSLPQAEKTEILQSDTGEFTGIRLTIDEKYFTYDVLGNLTKVESPDGKTNFFTYKKDVLGRITGYTVLGRTQLAFNGVPFPKEITLSAKDPQKLFDSGKEIASHDGNGFILGVFKESLNQWDVYSGTLSSEGDRLALKNFLKEVKPGQSVAAVVSDPSFSRLDEETLALFESLGAGEIRAVSAANKKWGFFGNKGLKTGDGFESVGEDSISTITETVAEMNFAPGADQNFEDRPMFLRLPGSVSQAYSRFLTRYETLRITGDMNILTVYDKSDEIVYAKRADGMNTYYELGKMRETYTAEGDLAYVYDYNCPDGGCNTNDDMKLSRISLVKARNEFEREAERLNEEIEQAKFDALYRLAWQDEVARLKIKENVESGIAAIMAEIRRLEPLRYQTVTQCSAGWSGEECESQTVEVPEVTSAINNLYSQRDELWKTQQEQLARLPGEIAARKLEIETASASAVHDLEEKKAEILFDLIEKEMEPILMDYYRSILGRDPSTQETKDWINRFKDSQAVDVELLESELGASLEKITREEERALIITGVESFLGNYLTMTDSEKAAKLAELQLSASEAVALDADEVDTILTYLKSRSLHFGQSAFLSLRSMLLARGVEVPMATIGLEAVLIDILTGTINPLTEGELLISVFAMDRVAEIHGKDFSGVLYSFDELKALYNNACLTEGDCAIRVIARVGEDHFVVVTKVTDTEVTCFETGKGKDGEAVTMSRDAFVKVWKAEEDGKGYLVVDAKDSTVMNRLTDEEAQRIRGSFWPFVFLIVSLVLTVASVAVSSFSPTLGKILGYAAMVAGIVSIVASVGNWVVQSAKMVYSNIAQNGLFQTVCQGLQNVGNFLVQTVQSVGRFFQSGFQFLKEGFTGGFASLGSGIMSVKNFVMAPAGVDGVKIFFTAGQQAARSLIAVGVGFGVSRGLEGLGLNSSLANLAGAFVGFGATGIGSGLSGFIKSGLQGMMLAGVSEMGLKLNLPPPIAGAISLLTSATLGAYFDPTLTLKQAITEITPALYSQFTLGGIDLLGRSMGLDPRITRLIGLPISAAVGVVTRHALGLNGYQDVFGNIKQAMLSSLVSVGSSIGLDAIGAPAALQSFVPGMLSQLIVSAGGTSSADAQEEGHGVFDEIASGVKKFGSGIVNAVGNVIGFGQKVLGSAGEFTVDGFKNGISAFSSIFSRETQENIYADEIGLRNAVVSIDGDKWIYQNDDTQIIYNSATDTFTENFGIGGIACIEGLGQDDAGNILYRELTYENIAEEGGIVTQAYENGLLRSWSYESTAGDSITFTGNGNSSFDQNGYLVDGVMTVSGSEYQIEDGRFQSIDIDCPVDVNAVTPPAGLETPWFEKYSLSSAADIGDAWLDDVADQIIGEAEATNGWILKATAVNTIKDVLKATITDVARLGDQAPLIGQNWNEMWDAWKAGRPVDSAFKFFALSGNILTEAGRALVIGSLAKGLVGAAIRGAGTLAEVLANESRFVNVAAEDFSSWISRMLKSKSADDIAALKQFFQNNPEMKEKFLDGIKQGSRNIDEVVTALRKKVLGLDDVRDYKILKSADEVNLDPKYNGFEPLPHKPGTTVVEKVGPAQELATKKWVRVSGEDNLARPWMMEESQYLQLKSESQVKGVDFGDYLKEKLQLPTKPTKASYFEPSGDEIFGYRESIINNPSNPADSLKQIEIVGKPALDNNDFVFKESIDD